VVVTGPWTTNAVAPATTLEVKLASYLIIAAAYDDFAPASPHETAPSLLIYFLEEVMDGSVSDSSSNTTKKWMDTTGKSPFYINPVNSIMSS
jgi:hypothetical protein